MSTPGPILELPGLEQIQLRGPIGLTARIVAAQPAVEIAWESEGEQPVELETLLQLVELGGMADTVVGSLWWQIWSMGHGGTSYDFPPFQLSSFDAGSIPRVPQWVFPSRGAVARLTTRRIRLLIWNGGAGSPLVRVSFNPVQSSAGWRPYPVSDFATVSGPALAHFPPHATEWRIVALPPQGIATDLVAEVDPSATLSTFAFYNNSPALATRLSVKYIGDLFDWTPIHPAEYAWAPLSSGPLGAVYR